MAYRIVVLLLAAVGFSFIDIYQSVAPAEVPRRLSEYGLFEGALAEHAPAPGVLPYSVNSPLFSDYAEKLRFVRLPESTTATYHPTGVFEFPVGTVISKTFGYPGKKGSRLIETRILRHEADGWRGYPYVWNEEQTDATLKLTGRNETITFRGPDGKKQTIDYHVPNVNECGGCHNYAGSMRPIGPSARQLNGEFDYDSGKQNQLRHWSEAGYLSALPTDPVEIPRLVSYDNLEAAIHERARAYLDANCGHCHRPDGPAGTSGMFLYYAETDPAAWGVRKPPVAAGRGAGNRRYGIEPGKPDRSILLYRMESTDNGERMPELGRALVHQEGVALIAEWIRSIE